MVVVVLFAGLYLLGEVDPSTFEATLLFVVPIALCAIEFGLWGGLAAGVLAVALLFAWDLSQPDVDLDAIGYFSRAVAFLLLGGLLGRFVTARRVLEDELARSEELSLDLIATAGFDGYFKRLNRAWERTLGWSADELRSQRFVDFVHPEDRERTLAETAKLAEASDAIGFRNRYRARDGSYRWLEWNASAVTEEEVIYANARDVTVLVQAEEAIERHGQSLEHTVRERTGELEQARLETLQRLALAAEYRDDDTHQHTERVGHTTMLLARELGLPEETVQSIRYAAPLHDVGKLGISDTILLKPGKLTAQEYRTMQEHARIGAAILANSSSHVLLMAEEIALTHHERWDGTGYPNGLADQEIPLTARITALADVFDAVTHKRPYKGAWPIDAALAEIRLASGTHFDPAVVEAFLTLDHTTLADQTLSDRDRMASEQNELLSARDRATADREQAAADGAGDVQDPAAYARNRAARDATTHDRDVVSVRREETAGDRRQAARTRNATARARDQAAHLRDRIADARDQQAREQDDSSEAQLDDSTNLDVIRKQAARDRTRAAADRQAAAGDRKRATQVREEAAHERMQAARDRAQAAHDRDSLAVTDALTTTRARAAGLAELQREIDRARHTTGSLVLAFVDVNGLRQVNDIEGHLAGDRLLTAVASALRDGLRSYDLIMRFGGDEFLCALSGIDTDEVKRRFDDLAKQLPGDSNRHSISTGFAELQDGDDTQALIASAEHALLQARQTN